MNKRDKLLWKSFGMALLAVLAACAYGQEAPAAAPEHPLTWVTLGTQGGPVLSGGRAEPANLLIVNGMPWVVDCGDGAMEHLVQAGYSPRFVDIAIISHLHMDHIGGLQALIGLRWMQNAQKPLTIYGPPGTDLVVAGIVQSMQEPARIWRDDLPNGPTPAQSVKVIIVKSGADLTVDGVRVRAVQNSHFALPNGGFADNGSQSLAFRFDYKNYSIGYTSDTGPSAAVIKLEKGVNLLVSEVIDLPAMTKVIEDIKMMPAAQKTAMIEHFALHHITPQDAGKMAEADGVQRLVFTHLSVPGKTDVYAKTLIDGAHEYFKGKVLVAHEQDRF